VAASGPPGGTGVVLPGWQDGRRGANASGRAEIRGGGEWAARGGTVTAGSYHRRHVHTAASTGSVVRASVVRASAVTASPAWGRLRAAVAAHARWLCPPLPAGPGVCAACRGPARPNYLYCFQCGLHAECAAGLLADAVVPLSYAVKGGRLARDLWVYKSALPGAGAARGALLSLLLVSLRDHGGCAWRLAGGGAPTHLAVVPSTRGRPGTHPLEALAARAFSLPRVHLAIPATPEPPDPEDRDLSVDRYVIRGRLPEARVLLLDDTWTTGAHAQSAAAALKLAGASRVAAVVLGRHLDATCGGSDAFGTLMRARRYDLAGERILPCPAAILRKGHGIPQEGKAGITGVI
jgi:hypothetical protein